MVLPNTAPTKINTTAISSSFTGLFSDSAQDHMPQDRGDQDQPDKEHPMKGVHIGLERRRDPVLKVL